MQNFLAIFVADVHISNKSKTFPYSLPAFLHTATTDKPGRWM